MRELSNRQKQILYHVMNGLTEKEIAEKEFIEITTVKTHLQEIYKYYNVHSKLKLVVKLWREKCNEIIRKFSKRNKLL